MKKVLTIAGSDCSGGAGIQADIKTITAHKMYAMSAITALTAQNTTGVYGVLPVSPEFVAQQLDCIFSDIRPDAVKIGMVSNGEIIRIIAEKLVEYQACNIVVDPVMVATSGGRLMVDDAAQALESLLFPLADLITPNIPEAESLSGISEIHTAQEMLRAARVLETKAKGAVLLKGGHLPDSADDLLCQKGKEIWICGKHIDTDNTHGTGCSLSSAIACGLAEGLSMEESVRDAKAYITAAMTTGLNLGRGNGPLNHCCRM